MTAIDIQYNDKHLNEVISIISRWLLFWTLERGLRRALIRCTLGSGKSKEGLGFWKGGREGAMGNKGEQFTDNLGPRWTIPVTTGGCQVSRKGG
jgi:hypothetical protein